ncbi:MAG: transposase [Chloroflexi bacterium]|nr:transposase [Chloroflexota bacterium]
MSRTRKTSPRLKGYDYTHPGYYFVTLVTQDRVNRFGEIRAGVMRLNPAGEIANRMWLELPQHYPNVVVDEFVVMPNHLHGIFALSVEELQDTRRDRFINLSLPDQSRHGLSEIIRGFKTWSARRINEAMGQTGAPLWQRSFYDRILRDEDELGNARAYIRANPANWGKDKDNPEHQID